MELDPRLHFVVATAIIVKDGPIDEAQHILSDSVLSSEQDRRIQDVAKKATKFLIAKRAAHEKAFPNKWTVPGGKLVLHEYSSLPKTSPNHPQWYNVVDWVLRKEVKEEVNLEIEKPQYLCDLVFVRPDGYPVVTLSYWARYKSGEVKLCKDLIDHAWVTVDEAKNYDLIDGIWEELAEVDKHLRKA